MAKKKVVYPYIPNSVPEARARMLQAVNAASTEEFYADVPKAIRLKGSLTCRCRCWLKRIWCATWKA